MDSKFGLETDVRRLWHRVTGTIVLLSSSVLAIFVVQWLSTK